MNKTLIALSFLISTQGSAVTNLCAGQPANTFFCIDDTNMLHCTGGDGFVAKFCKDQQGKPAAICVTQNPANSNPCVGKGSLHQHQLQALWWFPS